MVSTFDGYCGTCREKKDGDGDAAGTVCGHPTAKPGPRFCAPCALRMRVCMACGIPVLLPHTSAERED